MLLTFLNPKSDVHIETTTEVSCLFYKNGKKNPPILKFMQPVRTKEQNNLGEQRTYSGAFRLPEFKTGKNARAGKPVTYKIVRDQ